jgi:hypothetical protein
MVSILAVGGCLEQLMSAASLPLLFIFLLGLRFPISAMSRDYGDHGDLGAPPPGLIPSNPTESLGISILPYVRGPHDDAGPLSS